MSLLATSDWSEARAHIATLAAMPADWGGWGERPLAPGTAGKCTALLTHLENAFAGTGAEVEILVSPRSDGDVQIGINVGEAGFNYNVGAKERVAVFGAVDWSRGSGQGQPAVDDLVSALLGGD